MSEERRSSSSPLGCFAALIWGVVFILFTIYHNCPDLKRDIRIGLKPTEREVEQLKVCEMPPWEALWHELFEKEKRDEEKDATK